MTGGLLDLLTAFGLVLVIEGALYALAPETMRRVMEAARKLPAAWLRAAGLGAAALGVIVVWLVRG